MKCTIFTLATDDDNGTSGQAFGSERAMEDALIESTGSRYSGGYTREDFEGWLAENPDGDLNQWWDEHRGDLDSYTTDEERIDVDLCAQPLPPTGREQVAEAIECLKRARDLLKASGNRQTLARVRLALSSAKGAARIQISRDVRKQMEAANV
jgi:hypothetical protein